MWFTQTPKLQRVEVHQTELCPTQRATHLSLLQHGTVTGDSTLQPSESAGLALSSGVEGPARGELK